MLLDKVICMGGTNRIGTNTCHHNKKLNQRLDYLHLFWDLSKSLINEYSDVIKNFEKGMQARACCFQ